VAWTHTCGFAQAQTFILHACLLGCLLAVYTVKISRHPHCNCPDHDKGNLCKHILFVMLRVLKLSTTNPLVWQRALLTQEVSAFGTAFASLTSLSAAACWLYVFWRWLCGGGCFMVSSMHPLCRAACA
jgi:hypothetical protein